MLLDKAPLGHYDIQSLREKQAAIFQDYGKFALTARENVELGWPKAEADGYDVKQALVAAGINSDIESLPQGYDTMLGKNYSGGVDLSIGQWQRLALARAFARNASFLVLDEPTASMDPEAEYSLFQRFDDLTENRMTLLVTHRLSSIRMAGLDTRAR